MKALLLFGILTAVPFVASQSAIAGQQPPVPKAADDEATLTAQGWSLLAKGDTAAAAKKAAEAVKAAPRGMAALALTIEVGVARGGSRAALDEYERWLGKRALEEPAAVRRIAHALLEEMAVSPDRAGSFEARRALAADGDRNARDRLVAGMKDGNAADRRALAAMGDPEAVKVLINELSDPGNPMRIIAALGDSRQASAVEPIAAKLQDPRSEVRGAAAEALGKIGTPEAHRYLKGLLQDPSMHVKLKAAAALRAFNDPSGEPVFKELLAQAGDSTRSRLVAAEAMAGLPDPAWRRLVTGLLEADEPDVRLAAARLIAPYDPDAAQRVFQALREHPNPSVREEAGRQAATFGDDLTTLRRLFRTVDSLTRAAAAGRILALTR